jgi:hypothetical protein
VGREWICTAFSSAAADDDKAPPCVFWMAIQVRYGMGTRRIHEEPGMDRTFYPWVIRN